MNERHAITRLVNGTAGVQRQAMAQPVERLLVQSKGGTGLRAATHVKALFALDGRKLACLHKDSDHGDRCVTQLPDGRQVALEPGEFCHFGHADARGQLGRHPLLQRRYGPLLRGNPVVLTAYRGAAQCRPMGMLQYELGFGAVREATANAFDAFYPRPQPRGVDLRGVQMLQQALVNLGQPLIDLHIGSAVGGQGSAIFIADAYLSRHLLEGRKAKNVTHIGVLLGPNAFQRRERNIELNYAATMRELEKVYRDGWEHTFVDGLSIASAKPPFDLLLQCDLAEWPQGEDPGGRLSDTAMDEWLRQVALSVATLAQRAMHDKLQSLLLNVQGEDADDLSFGAFNAGLINANLDALTEAVALAKADDALAALAARCAEQ